MIPGIDVSHWQQEIDWSEVKRSGVHFAFIKATEIPDKRTALHIDARLHENIQGAQDNAIHWSAYHFFRTHIDPVVQAKLFCETVGEFSSLPPVIDLEVTGTRGERLNYKVRLFLDEVEKVTGRKPIIYTSGGFWRSYMCFEKRSHSDWAREYPLWAAQYTSLWPTALYPWAGWDFWQYTDKGKIPGIMTPVDMNWFNGSTEDLIERFIKNQEVRFESGIQENISEDLFQTGVDEKSYTLHEIPSDFKGDYQEPVQLQRQVTYSPRSEERSGQKTIFAENGSENRVEDWIKDYFLQSVQ